jgi:hypothetical protein
MNQSKLFFYLAVFNLLFVVVIIADCHFLPRTKVNEKFDFFSGVETGSRNGSYHTTYFVCKSGRKYQVPENFYFPFNEDSSLVIEKTAIFQTPLSISSPTKWDQNTSDISQIDNNRAFKAILIALTIVSLCVIIRRKTFAASGLDIIMLSIAFYMGLVLIVFF